MIFLKTQFSTIARQPILSRVGIFLGSLLVLWVPFAVPIYRWVPDPNWVSILSLGILYLEFIGLVKIWGRYVYQQPLFQRYGLLLTRKNGQDFGLGLSLGLLSLLTLISVESALGLLLWLPPKPDFWRVVLEGFAIALGVSFAEELLFRGWLLDELQRDYRRSVATGVNAFVFALVHFIKPWAEIRRTFPAFPGLGLLGLTLIWVKQVGQGRLGLSMGLHGGLVWGYYWVHVGQLIEYQDQVPVWITGIDANPLAGLMGMLWLSAIAFMSYRLSIKR